MLQALKEAEEAFKKEEVPIGAVIARGNQIIGRGHNLTQSLNDPTAHAEMLAIKEASVRLKDWRLDNCILCVTVEPCTMCVGGLSLARIPAVVFGVREPKSGALGSIYDLNLQEKPGSAARIIEGIKEAQCKELMQRFFRAKRVEVD